MADQPQPVGAGERLRLADDLYVEFVEIAGLREQDVNAQVMQPRHFDRLTENIRGRGQLESLPYVHRPGDEGPTSIVSGHHRARAARAAGLTHIPVLVDTRPMTSSQVAAKQIAHNELHGAPDEDILRQLIKMIDNVDDLLTTGLPDDLLPTVDPDDTQLAIPHAEFDWRTVTLLFLPHQLEAFTDALDQIDRASDTVCVACRDQYDRFAEAVLVYGRLRGIKSVATALGHLLNVAEREITQMEADGVEAGNWVRTAELVGGELPPDAATVVAQAVEQIAVDAGLPEGQRWRALELLAADYLAGAGNVNDVGFADYTKAG